VLDGDREAILQWLGADIEPTDVTRGAGEDREPLLSGQRK
jgi:hypothetical protein